MPGLDVAGPKLEDLTSRESPGQGAASLKLILTVFTVVNASSALECLLYGIHCILFAICCFILAKKRHATGSLVFLAAAVIMFGLSTADFSFTLSGQLVDIPKLIQGEISLDDVIRRNLPKCQLFVANNLIADLLLLYRCSMVWNFRRSVFVISVLLLLGDTIWGWVGAGISKAYLVTSWERFTATYFWSMFCVNVIMTLLIVGRIWWVTKRARPQLCSRDLRVYHTVIVVFAETAFVYSACILIAITLPKSNPYNTLATVAMVRLVSIMPTLLIVQIAGGRSFDDRFKKSDVEDIKPPDTSARATSGVLDTIIMTQASVGNDEVQEVPRREERPNDPGASA